MRRTTRGRLVARVRQSNAGQAIEQRWMRRAAVPATERRWSPAWRWTVIAVGLSAGGLLPETARWCVASLLVCAAATRPGRSGAVWCAVAFAVIGGGLRADAIDRAASGLAPRALTASLVTLTEPLPASSRDRSSTALATLGDGRKVQLGAPRFGKPSPALPRGAVVSVTGSVASLADEGNDARLRRQGVAGRVLANEIVWGGARRGGVLGAIDRFGEAAQRQLVDAVGARRGALLAGMALGTGDDIGSADSDALRDAGLWHLVAASGGNIALVVGLVMAIGWLLGASDRVRLLTSALAICAYVPLAGGGPSIQRAGVMGLAAMLALSLGRERRAADALALAAAATLAVDPRAVLDVGWQLSFAASAGLIVAGPRVAGWIGGFGVPRWLAAGLACTIVATVATAPVMLSAFGTLSLIGLVANALALPLVGIAVWSGALAALMTPIAPVVASICAQPGGVAAGLVLSVAEWSQQRSFAVIGAGAVAAIVVAAALVWVLRPPRLVVGLVAAAGMAALAFTVPSAPSEPRLVVLDIGQGSAALVQDGTDGVLVDAGPQDGGVVAALRKTGVRHLVAMVLSHPAADHDGGGAAVLTAFPTDLVLDGGDPGGGPTHDAAMRAAKAKRVRVIPVRAGQRLAFGRVQLWIRWPTPAASAAPGDPNDRAAVVQAQIGTLRAVIPADAEGNVLKDLPGLAGAVLVVSHHGSADPDLAAVLGHLHPQLAVISVGAGNTYGHPTASTLATLRSGRVPALRTDQGGSVDVRADASGRVLVKRGTG
jgi:competence protein ComEC